MGCTLMSVITNAYYAAIALISSK